MAPTGHARKKLSTATSHVPVGPAENVICGVTVVEALVRMMPLHRMVVREAGQRKFCANALPGKFSHRNKQAGAKRGRGAR